MPQYIPYTNQLIPPPILRRTIAQTNTTFTITTITDDPQWRNDIAMLSYRERHSSSEHRLITTQARADNILGTDFGSAVPNRGTEYHYDWLDELQHQFCEHMLLGAASQLVYLDPTQSASSGWRALATQPVVTVEDKHRRRDSHVDKRPALPLTTTRVPGRWQATRRSRPELRRRHLFRLDGLQFSRGYRRHHHSSLPAR